MITICFIGSVHPLLYCEDKKDDINTHEARKACPPDGSVEHYGTAKQSTEPEKKDSNLSRTLIPLVVHIPGSRNCLCLSSYALVHLVYDLTLAYIHEGLNLLIHSLKYLV